MTMEKHREEFGDTEVTYYRLDTPLEFVEALRDTGHDDGLNVVSYIKDNENGKIEDLVLASVPLEKGIPYSRLQHELVKNNPWLSNKQLYGEEDPEIV